VTCWLGLDCGGTFLKAGLYDQAGREHGSARRPLPVLSDRPGWAERDLEALWGAACDVLREVLERSGTAAGAVAGVGISAQGKGACLLDREGRPLGRGMLPSDQRALEQVRRWQGEGIPAALYPRTLQTLWTGHPVSLLRWVRDEEPERWRRVGSVVMAHDYLRHRLTGELACELTNISESNLYDMHAGRFDRGLAELLGIPEAVDRLPPIVGPAERAGVVTPEAAGRTGLLAGTPVVGGLFDVVAASLSAGLQDGTRLNAVMGTWSVTTGLADRIAVGRDHPFVHGRHAEPGHFIVHEASPTSAANLEWLASRMGGLDYAAIDAGVAALPRAGTDVLFVPFLYGSNAGLGMKAAFYGLQALHGQAHLAQAALEGVVFSHMVHLERMRRLFDRVEALRVTGGPTRSAVWMQLLADATGLRVETTRVAEPGCLGAAMAAAVGTGAFPGFPAAVRALVGAADAVEPDPAIHDAYQRKRRRYLALVEALQGYEQRVRDE
jgi:L-xylulokinase